MTRSFSSECFRCHIGQIHRFQISRQFASADRGWISTGFDYAKEKFRLIFHWVGAWWTTDVIQSGGEIRFSDFFFVKHNLYNISFIYLGHQKLHRKSISRRKYIWWVAIDEWSIVEKEWTNRCGLLVCIYYRNIFWRATTTRNHWMLQSRCAIVSMLWNVTKWIWWNRK